MINSHSKDSKIKYLVRCSFIEIYMEEIRDLLSKEDKKLVVKENENSGVYVKGATMYVAKKMPDIQKALERGHENRSVGETQMN